MLLFVRNLYYININKLFEVSLQFFFVLPLSHPIHKLNGAKNASDENINETTQIIRTINENIENEAESESKRA